MRSKMTLWRTGKRWRKRKRILMTTSFEPWLHAMPEVHFLISVSTIRSIHLDLVFCYNPKSWQWLGFWNWPRVFYHSISAAHLSLWFSVSLNLGENLPVFCILNQPTANTVCGVHVDGLGWVEDSWEKTPNISKHIENYFWVTA